MRGSTSDKTILVTGASSGFGLHIGNTLASAGYRVFGTGLEESPDRPGVRMIRMNADDDASVQACVARVMAESGRIDVLFNNAGFGLCGAIEDTSVDEAKAQFETNYFGAVRMLREVLPIMRRQQAGRVVVTGSLASEVALPFQPHYSASKYAIRALIDSLRLELGGTPLDATVIEPGDFATGFTAARRYAAGARTGILAAQMEATVGIMERDERSGPGPEAMGKLCLKLVEARKLKPVYAIGRRDQRLLVLLKRWIPASWFELIMARYYGLSRQA
jgi:NAD(P)-dependent dehydrogenase (short-subunit alcohol dehydrogenase family)